MVVKYLELRVSVARTVSCERTALVTTFVCTDVIVILPTTSVSAVSSPPTSTGKLFSPIRGEETYERLHTRMTTAVSSRVWNAFIRTHHVTSRKKVGKLKKAADRDEYVLIRSGGCPGLMYVEGDEDFVKEWTSQVSVCSVLAMLSQRMYLLYGRACDTRTTISSNDQLHSSAPSRCQRRYRAASMRSNLSLHSLSR